MRRTQLIKYSELRLAFLRANLFCHVCRSELSTQVHHIHGRRGQRLNDFNDCVAVCFGCHKQIHDHPAWARAKGYLV